MRLCSVSRTACLAATLLASALFGQPPAPEAPASESTGLPPRVSAADYQAHAKAGAINIGAEFMGHSVPTPDAIYTAEEYVVVEVGLFGAPNASAKLSTGDFSLRVNGKKTPSPAQSYVLVFKSLKDPEWGPTKKETKSKTSIGGGGGDNQDAPAAPPHMPIELRRAMEQRVQRASLLEGDRPLPQAGLIFFEYRGKRDGIRSLELIYSGSAGNATLALEP